MKILILNQAFYPDVVSTAQHAGDLAVRLAECGHQVTVVASRYGYDNPDYEFPSRESWRGISIERVSMLRLGKSSKWRRALVFGSFLTNCFTRIVRLPRFDAVIALTSPPLISALGAALVRLKGGKLVSWVMDLNPDEAIAAGWLRAGSAAARCLQAMLQFSLRRSDVVIALDSFMEARLLEKGVPPQKIAVIPPWSHDHAVYFDKDGRSEFRFKHGLQDKFVVMYSGNHSPCHPLSTLLEACRQLRDRRDIAFCFVGGGSEFRAVQEAAHSEDLQNVHCLPYQPIEKLSGSLSAADLHVVVMGDPFVGIVHPCKVYNIRTLGIPFLYIGPPESHITALHPAGQFRHGDVNGVRQFVVSSAQRKALGESGRYTTAEAARYSQQLLVQQMANLIAELAEGAETRIAATPALSDRLGINR